MTAKDAIRNLIVCHGMVPIHVVDQYMASCVSPLRAAEALAVHLFMCGRTDERLRNILLYVEDHGKFPDEVKV